MLIGPVSIGIRAYTGDIVLKLEARIDSKGEGKGEGIGRGAATGYGGNSDSGVIELEN